MHSEDTKAFVVVSTSCCIKQPKPARTKSLACIFSFYQFTFHPTTSRDAFFLSNWKSNKNLTRKILSSQDVIYHNEAYTNSGNCSADGSPEFETATESKVLSDGSLSPQRHQSFIAAVINAIKSAAKHTVNRKDPPSIAPVSQADNESDSTEMLDSETEPCLMMENVLEDVTMPDSHSHNMVSSTGLMLTSHMEIKTDAAMDKEEESIFNLSQAIANRQKIEQQTHLIMR